MQCGGNSWEELESNDGTGSTVSEFGWDGEMDQEEGGANSDSGCLCFWAPEGRGAQLRTEQSRRGTEDQSPSWDAVKISALCDTQVSGASWQQLTFTNEAKGFEETENH